MRILGFERVRKQLRPSGHFGLDTSNVYSAGNGSAAQLAWIEEESLTDDADSWRASIEESATKWLSKYTDFYGESRVGSASEFIKKLNKAPPLKRGLSWTDPNGDH